jgi:hypothetical protein
MGPKTRAVERQAKTSPRWDNEIIKHNAHSSETPCNGIFSSFAWRAPEAILRHLLPLPQSLRPRKSRAALREVFRMSSPNPPAPRASRPPRS